MADRSRRDRRAGAVVAALALMGGGAVAAGPAAHGADPPLGVLPDMVVESSVFALEAVHPTIDLQWDEGSVAISAGVIFELYTGAGAAVCDDLALEGSWLVPTTMGTIAGPTYWTSVPEVLGWKVLALGETPVVAESACATTEVRAFFTDVGGGHAFFAAIQRLGVDGLAAGYQPGPRFLPGNPQSRQAMAAFVQRVLAGGETAPACTTAPFTDVPVDHPFCAEIAWLKAEGIAAGYADGSFGPRGTVSRQAGAAFLARAFAAGEIPACTEAVFTDVPAGHAFCGEFRWLVDHAAAQGYEDGTFRPDLRMSRQAMASWIDHLRSPV